MMPYKNNNMIKKNDKKQVLIVTLLIVAILFSVASIVININMRADDFEPSDSLDDIDFPVGKGSGNLNIEILPSGGVSP